MLIGKLQFLLDLLRKITPKATIFCGLFMLLSACSEDARDDNTWLVGTSPDNPPYEFVQNGEPVGFDIDVIKEIAASLGKEVQFKSMEFHSLLAALSSGNIDMVIAGLSITDERKKRVDFSVPYSSAYIAILYRKEDDFKDYENLRGKTVGAQLGTVYSVVAHNLAANYHCRVNSLSNNLTLVEELKNKRIDALIIEQSQARRLKEIYPELNSITLDKFNSSFAIAFAKGSKLREPINHTINTLLNNGRFKEISEKWGITSDTREK